MKQIFILLILLASISLGSACNLQTTLLNQDPYPAMPGDYVKVIFQVDGLSGSKCGDVGFWITESFPFSLNSNEKNKVLLKTGSFVKDYSGYALVPYTFRVDKDALDGESSLSTSYSYALGGQNTILSTKFNITIQDSRTDFEIHVKDYDSVTEEVTFEILNIGENDVEGLTIEIIKSDSVDVVGSNRIIVGALDSSEEDTAKFTAKLERGDVNLKIHYTDSISVRRTLDKVISFDPDYFPEEEQTGKGLSATSAFVIGILIPIIIFLIRSKIRKRKEKAKREALRNGRR
ncbi:MAG: hypothetical protein KKB31_03335 [Nanoarchaeota archaeon]|nr:hypothetical protein [Nanoarchaeota archaeon]